MGRAQRGELEDIVRDMVAVLEAITEEIPDAMERLVNADRVQRPAKIVLARWRAMNEARAALSSVEKP